MAEIGPRAPLHLLLAALPLVPIFGRSKERGQVKGSGKHKERTRARGPCVQFLRLAFAGASPMQNSQKVATRCGVLQNKAPRRWPPTAHGGHAACCRGKPWAQAKRSQVPLLRLSLVGAAALVQVRINGCGSHQVHLLEPPQVHIVPAGNPLARVPSLGKSGEPVNCRGKATGWDFGWIRCGGTAANIPGSGPYPLLPFPPKLHSRGSSLLVEGRCHPDSNH